MVATSLLRLITLQRPNRSHNYRVSFEQFVLDSKTLWAVDELIRLATNVTRSIHPVTVLDAFTYKPSGNADIPDKCCHELLAQILRVMKPRVIIRYLTDDYHNAWMKQIELPAVDHQLVRKELQIDGNHTAIVMQSFHPSRAVNHAKFRPEYRALLIYHLVAGFAELNGPFRLRECAEEM